MSKFQGVIAGLSVLACVAIRPAVADTEDLAFYQARIIAVSHDVVETVRPTLNEHAQQVLDDIEFVAPTAWDTNADARRGFGNRKFVEFNAGFLAVTDWLSLAMIADWAGHDGCLREYTTYLSTLVGHNSRRVFKGKEMHTVSDFRKYAAESRGRCEGALQNVMLDPHSAEIREQMLDAIIATVLLHEIGHHVLDHVGGAEKTSMQRRMCEADADRWAIVTGVNANYDLRTAVPLFLFLAATGGGTLEEEIRSSHPSGLRRVRDLLVQTRALLDKKDPVSAHLMDVSIDDLNRYWAY